MKFFEKFDKQIIFRFLLSILLAAAALGLFLYSRGKLDKPPEEAQKDVAELLGPIDHDIDSVLAHFNIEKQWSRKQQFPIPNSKLNRTERRVKIPLDILPIQMNVAFSAMAKRYSGRAVASENLKEGTVTIHIELEGYVIQTIILKPNAELKRTKKEKPTKV